MAGNDWGWPKTAAVVIGGLLLARSLGGSFEQAADSVASDTAKAGAAIGAGVGAGKAAAAVGGAAAGRIAAGGNGGAKAPAGGAKAAPKAPASGAKPAEVAKICTTDIPLGGVNMKMPTQCPKEPEQKIPGAPDVNRLKE